MKKHIILLSSTFLFSSLLLNNSVSAMHELEDLDLPHILGRQTIRESFSPKTRNVTLPFFQRAEVQKISYVSSFLRGIGNGIYAKTQEVCNQFVGLSSLLMQKNSPTALMSLSNTEVLLNNNSVPLSKNNRVTALPNITQAQKNKKTIYILSIDGGGIRGVIPAQVLTRMEEDLKSKDIFDRQVGIAECFDLIAGTSTGGIIALGLNVPNEEYPPRPLYPAEELLNLYKTRGNIIFPQGGAGLFKRAKDLKSPKYDVDPLEDLLRIYFKDHKTYKSISNILITSFDVLTDAPFFFKNYDYKNDIGKCKQKRHGNYFMRDAARATSAAPTYFKGVEIFDCAGTKGNFVDGGVVVNNPTAAALTEAMKVFGPDVTNYVIISLGTGETPAKNYWPQIAEGGSLDWAPIIPDVMMKGASDFVDQQIKDMKEELVKHGITIQYERVQPILAPEHMGLDNPTPENLDKLAKMADDAYGKKRVEILKILKELKEEENLKEKELSYNSKDKYELAKLKLKQRKTSQAKYLLHEAALEGNYEASYLLAKLLEHDFSKSDNSNALWSGLMKFWYSGHTAVFDERNPSPVHLATSAGFYYSKVLQNCQITKELSENEALKRAKYLNKAKYKIATILDKSVEKFLYPLEDDNMMTQEPWLRQAADAHHHKAEYTYALKLIKEAPDVAESYLFKSANNNYDKAELELARIYKQRGAKERAESKFESAARQGNIEAQYELSVLLKENIIAEQIKYKPNQSQLDALTERYHYWILSAARGGHPNAQYEMGRYWEDVSKGFTFGGRPEREQAKNWYTRASEHGHEDAKKRLLGL